MKLLISGATGFIGSHLVKKLLDADVKLYAVVRGSTKKKALDPRMHVYVFNGDMTKLISFMEKEKFDGVIHLASLFLVNHNTSDVSDLVNSNLLFSTQLLEASVVSNIPWFINTGTFTQHYKNKKYSPTNLYSATKEAFEVVAKYYVETSKIVFVTIKLFDTFGEGDTRPKVFSLWSKISKTKEVLDMSPGDQIIDINYVKNVADGYLQMIKILSKPKAKKISGKSYTLSSGRRMTLKKLSQLFEKVTGEKLNIKWGGRPYRDREVMVPWEKGENVPGWKPKITLEEGILATINAKN